MSVKRQSVVLVRGLFGMMLQIHVFVMQLLNGQVMLVAVNVRKIMLNITSRRLLYAVKQEHHLLLPHAWIWKICLWEIFVHLENTNR